MLIVQVENETAQVRYVLQSFEQYSILLGSTEKNDVVVVLSKQS